MKYFLTLLLAFIVHFVSAEDLKVLNINFGIIRVNGKTLQKGSVFNSKDRIVWSSDKQCMKVVGMDSHTVNVFAAQVFKVGKMTTIDELLFQKQRLSSRAGILMTPQDYQRFFNRGIALMHGFSIETGYSFDDSHFLFLQYEYESETINKRLPCIGHSVSFTDDIFSIDGRSFPPTMLTTRLYYYDMSTKEVILLADKFVIHVAPRQDCAIFLRSYVSDALTEAELTGLLTDYCCVCYPSVTFLPDDLALFLRSVR